MKKHPEVNLEGSVKLEKQVIKKVNPLKKKTRFNRQITWGEEFGDYSKNQNKKNRNPVITHCLSLKQV